MKTPEHCTGLSDIRQAIDSLDQQIIDALGLRMQYVKAASAFKPDQASIAAPDRVAAMLPPSTCTKWPACPPTSSTV